MVAAAVLAAGSALTTPTTALAAASDPVVTIAGPAPWHSTSVAVAPDGTIYVGFGHVIWRVSPDGTGSHFAGTAWDTIEPSPSADGRPAREMPLGYARAMAVADDGSLWVAGDGRLRRIDTNGIVHEVAGNGWETTPDGDLQPLGSVTGMAVLPDGGVVVINGRARVYRFSQSGAMVQLADLDPYWGRDVTVGPDGSIYVAAGGIFRLDGGAPQLVVGGGSTPADGVPVLDAGIHASSLAFEPDGDLLFVDQGRIRRAHLSQAAPTVGTVTGVIRLELREGTVATARYEHPTDIALHGDDLVVADGWRLREVPGVVTSPDLPPQQATPPAIAWTTQPADVPVTEEWGFDPPPAVEGPVRFDVVASSPDGHAIRDLAISDLRVGQRPLVEVTGPEAGVWLRLPGLHEVAVVVTDDFGSLEVLRLQFNLALPDEACPAEVEEDGFTDVPDTNVHESAIDCAVWRGLVLGFSAHGFEPGGTATRAQMATLLVNAISTAGRALPEGTDAFDDDNGSVHEENINRLAAAGIVSGVRARTFDPSAIVTRAQMATFLLRAYEYASGTSVPPAPDHFTDDQGSVHEPRINQVAEAGLVNGSGDGRFDPASHLRRDQMATFVIRLLDLALAR